jgi:hypothetical protein
MMKAKSIQGKSINEIKNNIEQFLDEGFMPTLAFVFMSKDLDWKGVSELLDHKGFDVFGATTEIEFTEEGIEDNGIVILLLDMNKSYYKIVLNEFEYSNAMETAGKIGETGIKTFSNPAFIISGSLRDWPGELLMDGIVNKVGNEVNIVGGMAGDVATFSGIIFTNNKSCKQGILSLILDNDKIELKGVAVSGFKAVGTEKVITKSEGGWIQTIDDKPAMEVIWQFIGRDIEETKISDQLVMLNTSYPLQLSRTIGKPVMRPTVMYNTETKAVFCGGSVIEGTPFRFSLPPDFEVIDTVIDSSREIKEKEMNEADAMLIFSCISRYSMFGPMIENESSGLAETWGKSMAGFFSLGEFGKVIGGKVPEFHGGTCSWVALREK